MSPGGTRKRRVSPGYSGVWLRDLVFFGTFFLKTKTREDRLSAFTGTFCCEIFVHVYIAHDGISSHDFDVHVCSDVLFIS